MQSERKTSSTPMAERAETSRAGLGRGVYVEAMRFDHWHKNGFALLGALAALATRSVDLTPDLAGRVLLGFLIVCIVSSANYVINEFLDASFDALHPVKRHRPIPSGRVNPEHLFLLAGILLSVALAVGPFFLSPSFNAACFALFVSGLLYNVQPVRAKDVPFFDVIVESVNNPIRLLVGWYAVLPDGTLPSVVLIVLFWAFGAFLMTGKRLAELGFLGDEAAAYRSTFGVYSRKSLGAAMAVYATLSLVLYGWIAWGSLPRLLWTVPLAAVILGWFAWLTVQPDSVVKDPEHMFLKQPLFTLFGLASFLVAVALVFGPF